MTISELRDKLVRKAGTTRNVAVFVNHYRRLYEPMEEYNPHTKEVELDDVTTQKVWGKYYDRWYDKSLNRVEISSDDGTRVVSTQLPKWGQVVKPTGGFTEIVVLFDGERFRAKYNFSTQEKIVNGFNPKTGDPCKIKELVAEPYVKKVGVANAMEDMEKQLQRAGVL